MTIIAVDRSSPTGTAGERNIDPVAVAEFFASLDPRYFRHRELVRYPLTAQLDAAFFDAACLVDYERLQQALDIGANVNVVHPGLGATALHMAVGRRNRELTQFLLDRGGRMDVEDKNHITVLEEAWQHARLHIDQQFSEWADRAWKQAKPKVRRGRVPSATP